MKVKKPSFSREVMMARLRRLFPWTKWLLHYKMADLRYDIIAGVTVGCTMVPQSMAYAQIAGVNPQYGLYSCFIPQFIYLFLGTSKDASLGPSSILAILLGQVNAINPYHNIDEYSMSYMCLLGLTSGLILLLIGILKMGFIVNLFSIPVISGFTSAAGFTIMASQLKSFFGLSAAPYDSPGVVIKQVANVFTRWEEIKIYDFAFGLSTLGFIMGMQFMPYLVETIMKSYNKKRPGRTELTPFQQTAMEYVRLVVATKNVLAFAFTTLAAYLLVQSDPAFDGLITITHKIESGLPPPKVPDFIITNSTDGTVLRSTGQIFTDLAVAIIIVPLMILLEGFATTKALGRKNGYAVVPTNELLAMGLSNTIQSFFQGIPVTAGVARSAINDQCKVKTLLSSVLAASIVIIALLFLTDVFYYISKAALAGIMIAAAYNLLDFRIFRSVAQEYWRDVIILTLTFLLCLFFDIAYGIMICIFINMITFLRPVVRMKIFVTHEKTGEDSDGKPVRTTVVQLSHGMKYPSADKFLDRIARILAKADKHVVLDCRFFTGIDYTGLQAIRGILLLAYQMNKHVIFTNLSERLQKKVEKIGLDHWTHAETVDDAVQTYNAEEQGIAFEPSEQQPTAAPTQEEERVVNRGLSTTDLTAPAIGLRAASRSSLRHIVSITRRPSHAHKFVTQRSVDRSIAPGTEHNSQQSSRKGTVTGGSDENSRQISVERTESISGEHDADWHKKQDVFLRQLSSQAFLYGDLPIAVGNVVTVDSAGESSDEMESIGEVDDVDYDDDNVTPNILRSRRGSSNASSANANVTDVPLATFTVDDDGRSSSQPQLIVPVRGLLAIPDSYRNHPRLGKRVSRISETFEDEEDMDQSAQSANDSDPSVAEHNTRQSDTSARSRHSHDPSYQPHQLESAVAEESDELGQQNKAFEGSTDDIAPPEKARDSNTSASFF